MNADRAAPSPSGWRYEYSRYGVGFMAVAKHVDQPHFRFKAAIDHMPDDRGKAAFEKLARMELTALFNL